MGGQCGKCAPQKPSAIHVADGSKADLTPRARCVNPPLNQAECLLWVKRVTSVRSRRSRNVRYASNTDRMDASQRTTALCH
jgi:hypothetical protein